MVRARLGRLAANVLVVAMLVLAAPAGAEEHGPAVLIPRPVYGNAPEAQRAVEVLALNTQAMQLFGQGKYNEAVAIQEKALALAERVLGPEHPDTLKSVNSLGNLYKAQGRYGEAEPLFKRALAASERVLGPEHPNTLASVASLGALYQAQGRYGEAEPLLKRALAGYERVLGPEHPNTLVSVSQSGRPL